MSKVKIGSKKFETRTGAEMDWSDWLTVSKNYEALQSETDQLLLLIKVFNLMQMLVPGLKEDDLKGVPLTAMSEVLTEVMSAVNGGEPVETEDEDDDSPDSPAKKD
jgi:hypothetical protein